MSAFSSDGRASGGTARPTPNQDETTKRQKSSFDKKKVDSKQTDDLGAEFEAQSDVVEDALGKAEEALESVEVRADDFRDKYLRLQAEWDNYRKRLASEQEAMRVRANEKLVEKLLPVLDDMERALEHAGDSSEVAGFASGIEAVHTKFIDALKSVSVEVIDPAGQPFDANLHYAVQKIEDVKIPDETVTTTVQKGYSMAGYVIRPAMVVVSTGGPTREKTD